MFGCSTLWIFIEYPQSRTSKHSAPYRTFQIENLGSLLKQVSKKSLAFSLFCAIFVVIWLPSAPKNGAKFIRVENTGLVLDIHGFG